jgi:hypothetical protein
VEHGDDGGITPRGWGWRRAGGGGGGWCKLQGGRRSLSLEGGIGSLFFFEEKGDDVDAGVSVSLGGLLLSGLKGGHLVGGAMW